MDAYLESNRRLWDEWTRIHETSEFYDLEGFRDASRARPGDLRPGIHLRAYEVEEVGDVAGKDLLHLQCHFGMDTLSWARLGARVVGMDFSPEAIALARRLADEIGIEASFVHANVYEAREALTETFDVVYTSRGVLWWLPDLERWAETVAGFLRPGGIFYITEFHPLTMALDDGPEATEPRLRYPYFARGEPLTFPVEGSYADPDADVESTVEHGWAHDIGEIVTSVAEAGLVVEFLHEFDRMTDMQLPFLAPDGEGFYRLPDDQDGELPLMFSLRARKPA